MVAFSANMPEPLKISLKYTGPNVANGSMPVDDVIEALQGFAGAYGKIANQIDPEVQHQLRVAAINTGSFELVILAWLLAAETDMEALRPVVDAARWVYGLVAGVVRAKKHTKGKPYDVSVKGEGNTVILINVDHSQLEIPPQVFEVFKSGLIDSDLNRIAAPLSPERIDSAEISATDDSEPITINAEEREAFSTTLDAVSRIETEIVGNFVSLNKERNYGSFRLGNGKNVRYRYTGGFPNRLHTDFSYEGPVRIKCIATLDQNLEVDSLEIKSVERLQKDLPLPPTIEPPTQ